MQREYIKQYREKIGNLTEEEYKKREVYLKQIADGTLQGPSTDVPSLNKDWNQYYSDTALMTTTPKMSMLDYLYVCNKEHLDDVAMDFYGRKITYREMLSNIINVKNKLKNSMGIKQDDVVSVGMPFVPETIYLLYGINDLGAICNMCDPRVPIDKFKDYINGVDKLYGRKSEVLITLDIVMPKVDCFINDTELRNVVYVNATNSISKLKSTVKKISDRLKGIKSTKVSDDSRYVNYNDKFEKTKILSDDEINDFFSNKESIYKKNSAAIIVYTSGTSGPPKGAVLSNDALNSMASRISESITNVDRGDKFLLIMPPFIAYGLAIGLHSQLCTGQELIVVPNFTMDKSKEMLYELLKKYKPQSIMGVPSFVNDLTTNPKAKKIDLSFLKNFIVGGDSISEQTEKLGNEYLKSHGSKATITKGWGMTELASCVTYTKNVNTNKIGSVGAPAVDVDVRILKTDGINVENIDSLEECNYGEVGEIFASAPTKMTRYLDVEKQKEIFYDSVDGKTYVRSKDLGKIEEDGNLYIKGRIKRIIIRPDGHNISPFAIEDIINADSRVKYSAVVGRNAEGYNEGKWAVAYIELKDEYKGLGFEQDIISDITKIQNEKLPPRDVASFYEFIDEMPLTNIGKIDFRALEQREINDENIKKHR